MSNIKHWVKAFRLRTLPLALSSIFMGAFLALEADSFNWKIFVLCITTTIVLQVLSNLANDYGDSIHGADSSDRKGPQRAVQSGAISKSSMKAGVLIFVVLSLASGIALLIVSFSNDWKSLLYFFLIGLLCIAAAIAYTMGKKPYGYAGLGDISVFIFFGLVGVTGSYYLFSKSMEWSVLLPAASCGVFSMAVLNINNIRDIESDFKAGKYSVPVRIGKRKAAIYHCVLLASGVIAALGYTILHYRSPIQFAFLAVTPLLVKNGVAITGKESQQLDPFLKQMALTTLLFVLLFGLGLAFSS